MTRRRPPRANPIAGPLLVVSAFEPELGALRSALQRLPRLSRHVAALPVGIGPIEAAIGTARVLARFNPRAVFFLGTAGCYPTPAKSSRAGSSPPWASTLSIGGVAVARRIMLGSAALARGEGYRPAAMSGEVETDAGLRRALAGSRFRRPVTPTVDVATPTAITLSLGLARRLAASTGAQVENLEAYAVARAAAAAGLPFAAILGVSNHVGPNAHREWRRHATQATGAATRTLLALLATMLALPEPSEPVKAPSRRSSPKPTGKPRPRPRGESARPPRPARRAR